MKSIYNSKLNIKLPEHIQFAIEMLDDSTKSKFYFLINAILDCLPKDKVKIMFRESQGCLNFDYPPKSYRMNMDWAAIGRKLK